MSQDFSLGPNFPSPPSDPDAKDWLSLPEGDTHLCHGGVCYPLLRHCINLCEPGFALEFGVQSGHSLALISQRLSAVGFDSFLGLPEAWGPFTPGAFAQDDPPTVPNARLVTGWFSDTLPTFDFASVAPLRLVHIDCDLYSSTKTVLNHVGQHLKPGTFVVFDEFVHDWDASKPGEEQVAWREFAERAQIGWKVIGNSSGAWAVQIA
jgi:hypothetical protein